MTAGFVPAFEGQKCSLGYQAIEWLETYACHGPGDVEGDPLDFRTDPEVEQFIIDCYALDPATGRRLVDRAAYSAPKGRAKSGRVFYNLMYRRKTRLFSHHVGVESLPSYEAATAAYGRLRNLFERYIDEMTAKTIRAIDREASKCKNQKS